MIVARRKRLDCGLSKREELGREKGKFYISQVFARDIVRKQEGRKNAQDTHEESL
jgi:hypothetical protein